MKKLAIIIIMVFLSSCEKLINLTPVSELNSSNYYVSASDFNNALIAAYDALQEKNSIDFVMNEIRSDNGTEMKYQYEKDLDNFSVSSTNELISKFWKIAYKGIFRTNILLEKIETADIDAAQKDLIIGQAKFIRAYIYFDLVRYFGDVPLITKGLKLSESYSVKRSPVADVYQLIEADLKDAALVLPSVYTGNDVGRITKGASNSYARKSIPYTKKICRIKNFA